MDEDQLDGDDLTQIKAVYRVKFERNALCDLCRKCFEPELSKKALYGIGQD